ncbi:MAG: NAD(+) diphosphatase [Myxococcota bacterium]
MSTTWDRAAHRRRDEEWLNTAKRDAWLIPVWRSKNLVDEGRPPRGIWVRASDHPTVLESEDTPSIFLGLADGVPVFARDLSHLDDLEDYSFPGRFRDLRMAGAFMDPDAFAPLAYARGMCRWHRVTKFCSSCGGKLAAEEGGFARRCDACGEIVYPRTDPAVMILITHGDRCLLARQPRFPKGMYSALAGFVEVGETIEECVHRETLEEVGLAVTGVRYVASQPWPFPQSLMIGFRAVATSDAFSLDDDELEEARWVRRDELRNPKGFFYPPPMSLAHHLVQQFLDE